MYGLWTILLANIWWCGHNQVYSYLLWCCSALTHRMIPFQPIHLIWLSEPQGLDNNSLYQWMQCIRFVVLKIVVNDLSNRYSHAIYEYHSQKLYEMVHCFHQVFCLLSLAQIANWSSIRHLHAFISSCIKEFEPAM